MSLIGFLVLLLIAAFAGALGQMIGGFSRGGCIVSILLGFVGAWVGTWIAQQFGLPEFFPVVIDGRPFPVVWAIIGAALVSAILSLFTRRRTVVYRS